MRLGNKEFLALVEANMEAVRKQQFAKLGSTQFAQLKIISKKLRKKNEGAMSFEEWAPVFVGREIRNWMIDTIEEMKPDGDAPDYTRPEWENFTILQEYVVKGEAPVLIQERLGLGRAQFFAKKKTAYEILGVALWDSAQAIKKPVETKHNLPAARYDRFILRTDEHDEQYHTRILHALAGRHWIIAIVGSPGVGKSALAYRVAQLCYEKELFETIIWFPFQRSELALSGEGIPYPSRITSFDEFLNTIAATTGQRAALREDNTNKKRTLVHAILSSTQCLLVLDNFQVFDDEAGIQILDFLNDLPTPSKAILTSRENASVLRQSGVQRIYLAEMKKDEAIEFVSDLAGQKRLPLDNSELKRIVEISDQVPLVMEHALGLAEMGYTLEQLQQIKVGKPKLFPFLYDELYDKRRVEEKKIWHTMSLLRQPAPIVAVEQACDVANMFTPSFGNLQVLGLIIKLRDQTIDLPNQAKEYLIELRRKDKDSLMKLDAEPVVVYLQVRVRLSKYYAKKLASLVIDKRLDFLRHQKYNVFMCMEWSDENEEWDTLLSLIDAMGQPLGILGRLETRLEWGKRASEVSRLIFDNEIKAAWHETFDVGWCLARQGKLEEARRFFLKRLKDDPDISYLPVNAVALRNLGTIARDEKSFTEAKRYLNRSLNAWNTLQDLDSEVLEETLEGLIHWKGIDAKEWVTAWYASTLDSLGKLEYEESHYESAQEYLEDAQSSQQQLGHHGETAESQILLALVYLKLEKSEKAEIMKDRSLAIANELPYPAPSYAFVKHREGEYHWILGHKHKALLSWQAALDCYEALGMNGYARQVSVVELMDTIRSVAKTTDYAGRHGGPNHAQ